MAVDLDVTVDAAGVVIESVEGLHGAGDEHDETDDDGRVDDLEGEREELVPAEVRVRGAEDALGKDEVDDEEQDDAGGDEDLRGNGDAYVGYVDRPDDAHYAGHDSGHAEAEH